MKIGIYGGTFDPPHLGHMEAARAAAAALKLDRLILIPDKIPPHKQMSQDSATPQQRLEMTAIMADGLLMRDRAVADDLELKREGPSFTADTLRAMKERYPHDELWLLVGTDMYLSIQSWREPEVILSLAALAAFSRAESDSREEMEEHRRYLKKTFGIRVKLIDLPQVREISSTQVRQNCTGEGLFPPVYGYILRHGLYGTNKDLHHLNYDELRACSLSMVYAKRHAHIRGVEEEAVKLARRWGADEDVARRAGILHDCTKYLTLEEHLELCDRYGLELDELERSNAKLLHAKTGAIQARELYGQEEEVFEAILWHTTGRPNMTLQEKILYLADYIEPNRAFAGVEEMRRLAYTDIDAALDMGLTMSVNDLLERGAVIHEDTQGALDWVREHRKGS